MTDKNETIRNIYFNPIAGFGSINDTFQQAKKIDPSIKYNDVKDFMSKLSHKQTQFRYKGYNSFVPEHALFELEVDLIDMTKVAEENDGFRYGLVALDNFSKKACVVPMKTKQIPDVVKAFEKYWKK